jgi:hypothetical protein
VGYAGTEQKMICAFPDANHLRNCGDVDDDVGLHEAEIQQRAERLPTCQHFRRDIVARQQFQSGA